MRLTRRAAIVAALLFYGVFYLPTAVHAQTITYARDAAGKYTLKVAFPDGTVVTLPNLTGTPPAVTPPVPTPPTAPAGFAAVGLNASGTVSVRLSWQAAAAGTVDGYSLTRGGQALAQLAGTATTFTDGSASLMPGMSYTYQLVAKKGSLTSATANAVVIIPPTQETGPGSPPDTGPPPGNLPPLTIAALYPNDDSFVIKVVPFPGAVDYLAYDDGNPADRKASGGNILLEWNGPLKGKLVVQALSALAPFSPHGGNMSGMAGMGGAVTNGQGAPTNPVNPIAQSGQITPQYKPITPSAGASQFSLYRSNPPASLAKTSDGKTNASWVTSDGLLKFTAWNADFISSDSFISHTHFMEDLYDGGTPGTGLPPHVQNATLTMDYAPVFDWSGGRVLHASVEVDARFDARRWCEMWIVPAGDMILNPENVEIINNGGADWSHTMPTTSGNLFVWRWDTFHKPFVIRSSGGVKTVTPIVHWDWNDAGGFADRFTAANRAEVAYKPGAFLNGKPNIDLDLRHRFDLYLSSARVVGYETDAEGVRVKVFDKAMATPPGFERGRIVLTHKLYHSSLELEELKQYNPAETYWILRTPNSEVRHWDSLYGEVMPSFPSN